MIIQQKAYTINIQIGIHFFRITIFQILNQMVEKFILFQIPPFLFMISLIIKLKKLTHLMVFQVMKFHHFSLATKII